MPQLPIGRPRVAQLERDLVELMARHEEYLRRVDGDPRVAADLAKFVCVRITGFLEQSVAELARKHCEHGPESAVRFARSWLDRMQNPKKGALLKFVQRFDHQWGDDLAALFQSIDPNETFDNLVQTRNDIAHGASAGIQKATLDTYFAMVVDVVEFFRTRLTPP